MVDLPKRVIQNIDEDASVTALAVESLSNRLAAVGKLLPLATRFSQKNVELVHYLRIWTRRTSAALNLFRSLLPPQEYREASKKIKRIRRAANSARDLDVMILKTKSRKKSKLQKQLLKNLARQRKAAQKSIDQVYRQFYCKDKWKKFSRQLISSISSENTVEHCSPSETSEVSDQSSDKIPFDKSLAQAPARVWAVISLRQELDRFLAAQPPSDARLVELHQFRIKAKQLRYSIELLAPFLPPPFFNEVSNHLAEIQESLGDYNDLRNAIAILKKQSKKSSDLHQEKWKRQLLKKKQKSKAMRRDINQKLPEILQQLRQRLDDPIPADISGPVYSPHTD